MLPGGPIQDHPGVPRPAETCVEPRSGLRVEGVPRQVRVTPLRDDHPGELLHVNPVLKAEVRERGQVAHHPPEQVVLHPGPLRRALEQLAHSRREVDPRAARKPEQFAPDFEDDRANLAKQYRELLLDSVELRISTGAKNAFTLSGGLDSSSVTSCARNITGQQQTAYSAIYEDKTFDESDEIRPMLKENVSQWNAVLIGNEIDLLLDAGILQNNNPSKIYVFEDDAISQIR